MKTNPGKLLLVATTVVAFGVRSLLGQAAPTTGTATEDTVKLDPFNVSAASDVGFVAANSLAGGRISTALKDTPVAYSVLTSEFLEAFNINDAGKAAEFTVNANQYYNDGLQGTDGNTTVYVRIRGQNANTPARNFFPYNLAGDSYNIDRIDFARGANASLFGAGASAGTQNTVSKQALTTRTIREVRAQAGSWDRYRLTVDVNQPVTEKLAVRTNLLWSTGLTWRDREWERRKGADFAVTYNFTPKLSMRAEYEYRTTDKNTGTNRTRDNTSAWDGKFTPTGIDLSMTAAQMAIYGVSRAAQRFVVDPDRQDTVYNIQNRFQTKGAAYNATTPNYLNGQVIKSIGFNLSNTSMTNVWDNPNRFAATYAGSPFFMIPGPSFTPMWDKDYRYPLGWERGEDMAVYLTWRPFEGLFAELSGDRNTVARWSEYAATGGMYNMFVDINRNKPDGSPNPYFLHPYSENTPFAFHKNPGYHSSNLQVVYVKNTRLGKLQIGAMAGIQYLDQNNRQDFFILPLQNGVQPGADFRAFFGQADQNIQSVYTRQYTDLRGKLASRHPEQSPMNVFDPTRGTSAVMTPKWYVQPSRPGFSDDLSKRYRFIQVPVNLNLFKNHLVLIGAFRRDQTKMIDRQFKLADDMPVGWDGSYVSNKPTAPSDYYTMLYTPKNAAGVAIANPIPAASRPRQAINGVNVPLAQYANDRFMDDYSPPDVVTGVNTKTYGAVINLTSWLGIYGNNSTTFDLNAGNTNAYAQLIPPTASQSYDAGIRFTLPNGKMSASLGWYRAYQEGQLYSIGFSFMSNVNTFANAPIVGNLGDSGGNQRGFAVLPGRDVYSTLTSETTGYEFELTANLTKNWRMILNAGTNKPVQKNVMPELPGWIAEHDAVIRQIMADTGILINPTTNQATINPALDDPTKINQTRVNSVVNAWNSYVQTTIPGILLTNKTESRQSGGKVGGPAFTTNIATDYRFQSGWVKGLRAGIAINYRGRQILAARTADTIVNPNNPATTLPDPTAGATSYLWAGGYAKGTANLSYTYRLKESGRYAPKTVQFDLAIDNLLGLSRPIMETATNGTASSIVTVPRNNDISQSAIMTVPGSYNYQPPRNYMLTAKLNF